MARLTELENQLLALYITTFNIEAKTNTVAEAALAIIYSAPEEIHETLFQHLYHSNPFYLLYIRSADDAAVFRKIEDKLPCATFDLTIPGQGMFSLILYEKKELDRMGGHLVDDEYEGEKQKKYQVKDSLPMWMLSSVDVVAAESNLLNKKSPFSFICGRPTFRW